MSPLRYLAMAVLLALSLSTAATALPTKILDGHIILDNADAFFPLGVYMHNATPALLAVVSDAGFNSVLSYDFGPGYNNLSNFSQVQTFLDDAHILDLQVIYAMNGFFDRPPYNQTRGAEWARGIATTFRDHPALAIYYTTDERPESWIPDLVRRRAMLKATDPDHITMSIFMCTQNAGNFLAVSDAIGYDPYPWQNCCDPTVTAHCSNMVQHCTKNQSGENITSLAEVYGNLSRTLESLPSHAGICAPQMMDWGIYEGATSNKTAPPLQVQRAMSYAAVLIGHCQGLVFYSFYDLFRAPYEKLSTNKTLVAKRLADFRTLGTELKDNMGFFAGASSGAAAVEWRLGGAPMWVFADVRTESSSAKGGPDRGQRRRLFILNLDADATDRFELRVSGEKAWRSVALSAYGVLAFDIAPGITTGTSTSTNPSTSVFSWQV